MNGLDDTQTECLSAVHAFLGSPAGQAAIAGHLQRRRLPGCFDTDIEERVAGEAYRFLCGGNTIASVPGWCARRIAARAVDLARGQMRRERHAGIPVEWDDNDVEAPGAAEVGETAVTHVRQTLCAGDGAHWQVAAALAVVCVVADEAVPHATCPQPTTRADDVDAAHWAGLWYAGLDVCFPDGDSVAATVRQRRVRAMAKVRRVLADAAGTVGR
jgi:hypothetical protein